MDKKTIIFLAAIAALAIALIAVAYFVPVHHSSGISGNADDFQMTFCGQNFLNQSTGCYVAVFNLTKTVQQLDNGGAL